MEEESRVEDLEPREKDTKEVKGGAATRGTSKPYDPGEGAGGGV
jgi:hypothetical protein